MHELWEGSLLLIKVSCSYPSRSVKVAESLTAQNSKCFIHLFTFSYVQLSLARAWFAAREKGHEWNKCPFFLLEIMKTVRK